METLDVHVASLKRFFDQHKRMPSYDEMRKIFSCKSKDTAYSIAGRLIEKGYIAKDGRGKLIPTGILGELKILGIVEAGFPSPAEEDRTDTVSLDDYLIANREASYMLKVKGDSMIDAGIREGDMVIVERGVSAKVGDIVIANVDGEFTMKYYRIRNRIVYLEAANPHFKPIFPDGELKIEAVVRAVVRRYS